MGFLKDNKRRFLTDIDYQLLSEDDKLDIFIDSIFEIFDELNERGPDQFHTLIDIDLIPEDLINHISALVGWRQTDYNYNYLTYRDLVKNIVRIYKIKGTRLSYEVFFRALGYNANIYELWWDSQGNLVRDRPIGAPNPVLPNYILNKSNFVEFELDISFANDPAFPDPFVSGNDEFLRIMIDYLKFLKPVHIRYKPILLNIPRFVERPVLLEKITPVVMLGDLLHPNNGLNYDQIPEPVDNFALYGLEQIYDYTNFLYDNTIHYGSNLLRTATYDSVEYPVSIVQREDVLYGASNCPIQDEFKITVGLTKQIADDRFELRYNKYINYNEVVEYNPVVTEVKDEFDYDSPEYSFGQGNLFEKP